MYAKLVSQQEEIDQTALRKVSTHMESAKRKTSAVNEQNEGGELENLLDALKAEEDEQDEDLILEKQKMKEAEELDKAKDEQVAASTASIRDSKKQGDVFKKKVGEYNKPMILSVLGMFMCIIIGCQNPIFGALLIKCIFSMLWLPVD